MAPTPSPRTTPGHHHHHQQQHQTPSKTPQSKQRLQYPNSKNAVATPLSAGAVAVPTEHPVEVIGRVRNYPDHKERVASALEIAGDGRSVRVRTDVGYRDFSLDGVSVADDEGLEGFYRRFVGSRVEGVRLGATCTIMMYGPTGSGKSHTMFGCAKEPGIVYRALRDILNGGDGERAGGGAGSGGEDDTGFDVGLFVQVAVLEIYNEEIYDLLSGNSGAAGGGGGTPTTSGVPKGSAPKVRLEVMGKKAKNATYITGNEAGKMSREVAKVEKRRIVKSTLCNERSSRSHCLIILEVPSVGGRLMLVDMAGSENIEAAGQTGFEAKMQTAKINQGNIALKRVVESIANGDSHVPFRDSKLTMLLQDSFEDDKSKILMILCASPDPKEMHKTVSTLEYGAKAKCIVRVTNMPTAKEKLESEESSTLLRSRLVAMNQFIFKLQTENKIKEKEREEAHKELLQKDQKLAELRAKLQLIEGRGSAMEEEEIKLKVEQRTAILRVELMKMEERMLRQQEELKILRRRLEEVELERCKLGEDASSQIHGGRFMKRLQACCGGDQGMEKSMDLDMGDQPNIFDVKEITEDAPQLDNCWKPSSPNPCLFAMEEEEGDADDILRLPEKVPLSTVYEEEEEEEEGEDRESAKDEVDKLVVEETVGHAKKADAFGSFVDSEDFYCMMMNDKCECGTDTVKKSPKDASSARKARIQNIFRLCGNHREVAHQVKKTCMPPRERHAEEKIQLYTPPAQRDLDEDALHSERQPLLKTLDCRHEPSEISSVVVPFLKKRDASEASVEEDKENSMHGLVQSGELIDVFVKWEASNELSGGGGGLIKKQKISKGSSLADLRKIIEEDDNNGKFTFLLLGDPSGAPVAREKEAATPVSKLPICNNQANGYLACLRPTKRAMQLPSHTPLGSLENTLQVVGLKNSQLGEGLLPKLSQLDTSYLTSLRV